MTVLNQVSAASIADDNWKARLARVPTPMGGLALGIASLGAAWAIVLPEQGEGLKLVAATVAALLVIQVVLKFLLHPRLIREDLGYPVISSVMPTFAILAAPASLSLAGYLTIMSEPNLMLVSVLTPLAIFMTAIVYIAFVRLLRLPFSPGYAAFTFPTVIGATALLKLGSALEAVSSGLFFRLGLLELVVATLMVFYVAARYAFFYMGPVIGRK